MTSAEGKGSGITWATLFSRISPDDPLTMGSVLIMFMVDIVLYSIIIWYVDKIAPGKYGVAEKWYFPFSLGYWLSNNNRVTDLDDFDKDIVKDVSMFETEPTSKAGIKVVGLRKEFKKVEKFQVKSFIKQCFIPNVVGGLSWDCTFGHRPAFR